MAAPAALCRRLGPAGGCAPVQQLRMPVAAQRGVTLLEIMFAIAMIAVLSAIAVPAYRAHLARVDLNRAIGDVHDIGLSLERWQLNNGRFPDTLAEAGLGGRVDPWGNPYRYLNMDGARRGDMRKDKNLVPINTDFDLYSVGKDGESVPPLTAKKSQDDIVRASNGAFVGLGSEY